MSLFGSKGNEMSTYLAARSVPPTFIIGMNTTDCLLFQVSKSTVLRDGSGKIQGIELVIGTPNRKVKGPYDLISRLSSSHWRLSNMQKGQEKSKSCNTCPRRNIRRLTTSSVTCTRNRPMSLSPHVHRSRRNTRVYRDFHAFSQRSLTLYSLGRVRFSLDLCLRSPGITCLIPIRAKLPESAILSTYNCL